MNSIFGVGSPSTPFGADDQPKESRSRTFSINNMGINTMGIKLKESMSMGTSDVSNDSSDPGLIR